MKWRRKDLRRRSTKYEGVLWRALRNNQLGVRFKRQYSISNYVVDLYCHKAKLAIEIDGAVHAINKKYDNYRTRYLEALGVKEIRFRNWEIEKFLPEVILSIKKLLPSPKVRRGTEGEVNEVNED
jgi:very-short-patch-repair endonuclease